MSKNITQLSGRKGIQDNLFDRMGQLAQQTGAPSKEELAKLADEFLLGKATTYGTTTFYDFLKPDNQGKKVYVCNGSACQNARTQGKVKNALAEHFEGAEIGHITCLGRCHENGAFQLKGHNYSNLSEAEIHTLITENEGPKTDHYHVESLGKGTLTQGIPGGVEQFAERWTHLHMLGLKPADVLAEIKASQLRGRGGAGFPIGIKLAGLAAEQSETKFIICNADEGDPGAYSDRYLLEQQPYSVLFGMMIAGLASGANWGILYIRAEYPEAVTIIEGAIKTLRQKQLIGRNAITPDFKFDFKVIKAQGAYICGEETALINSIEGQRPEVRTRPPYPTQEGLFGKPTAVNNVETLAALPSLFQDGAAYAKIGTAASTGTKLISLDSFFNRPGIYEVDMGTPLTQVIEELGQGFREKIKGLHIGGPLGGIVPTEKIKDLTIDFESFKANGFLLGHASIVCIPETKPMMEYLEELMDFAAYESCGKCFPCRLGTQRALELIQKANHDNYLIDKGLFDDLLFTLETGSLCAHGGGIPLPVRNAMTYYKGELEQYFT
ncbi:MAG TPA: formate dehydrogenase [Saprospiraceae bacterium]|nr:formate dehydrogenase [Saprospiraceae bacterium]